MIHLEPEYLQMVCQILRPYPYRFYVFGSRVKGTNQRFSDLDICVKGNISRKELSAILQQMDDSKLPITVDLVAWDMCTDEFKQLIEPDLVYLEI